MPAGELELLPPPVAAPPVNKQLFANQPALVSEYLALSGDPDTLHGHRPPNLAITHEKPEHRLVMYLKLEGFSNREISQRTGYTEPWVSQLVRQPWFQRRLLDELKAVGRSDMMDFLKVQGEDSFLRLVDLRDNAKSEQVQAHCADSILDRLYGKAVQRSEVKMETSRTIEKVEDVRSAITALEEREKELTEKLKLYGQ